MCSTLFIFMHVRACFHSFALSPAQKACVRRVQTVAHSNIQTIFNRVLLVSPPISLHFPKQKCKNVRFLCKIHLLIIDYYYYICWIYIARLKRDILMVNLACGILQDVQKNRVDFSIFFFLVVFFLNKNSISLFKDLNVYLRNQSQANNVSACERGWACACVRLLACERVFLVVVLNWRKFIDPLNVHTVKFTFACISIE